MQKREAESEGYYVYLNKKAEKSVILAAVNKSKDIYGFAFNGHGNAGRICPYPPAAAT